jgi:hypothetical protein
MTAILTSWIETGATANGHRQKSAAAARDSGSGRYAATSGLGRLSARRARAWTHGSRYGYLVREFVEFINLDHDLCILAARRLPA